MNPVRVPAPLIYHGEATNRPVVYVDDIPLVVANHLRAMAGRYPSGATLRAALLAEAEQLTDGDAA